MSRGFQYSDEYISQAMHGLAWCVAGHNWMAIPQPVGRDVAGAMMAPRISLRRPTLRGSFGSVRSGLPRPNPLSRTRDVAVCPFNSTARAILMHDEDSDALIAARTCMQPAPSRAQSPSSARAPCLSGQERAGRCGAGHLEASRTLLSKFAAVIGAVISRLLAVAWGAAAAMVGLTAWAVFAWLEAAWAAWAAWAIAMSCGTDKRPVWRRAARHSGASRVWLVMLIAANATAQPALPKGVPPSPPPYFTQTVSFRIAFTSGIGYDSFSALLL